MSDAPRLFDVPDVPESVVDHPTLSADQRLTIRNRQALEQGRHPATGLPLDYDHICGTCTHHHAYRMGHTYHKCDLHRLGESHSAASDIRVNWPACTRWAEAMLACEGDE